MCTYRNYAFSAELVREKTLQHEELHSAVTDMQVLGRENTFYSIFPLKYLAWKFDIEKKK